MKNLIRAAVAAALTLTGLALGGVADATYEPSYSLNTPTIQCGAQDWSASVTVNIPTSGSVNYTVTQYAPNATTVINSYTTTDADGGSSTFSFGPFATNARFQPFRIVATWSETNSYTVARPSRAWEAFEPNHRGCPMPMPTPTLARTCGELDVVTLPTGVTWYNTSNDWQTVSGTLTLQPNQVVNLFPSPPVGFYFEEESESEFAGFTFTGQAIEACPTTTTAAPQTTAAPTTTVAATVTTVAASPTTTGAPTTATTAVQATSTPPTVPTATKPAPKVNTQLPSTGVDSLIIALVALGFVLLGLSALRLLNRNRRVALKRLTKI